MLLGLIHAPQWTTANIAIAGMQVLGLSAASGEMQGNNAGYSKFADPDAGFKVPSRLGMVLLYSPALVVSLGYLKTSPNNNGREKVTSGLLAIHFGKRVLESLFLHKYSSTMNGDFLLPIGMSYALTAAMFAHQQRAIAAYAGSATDNLMLRAGLVFSAVGQLGNFYHHWLLTQLRPPKSAGGGEEKKYVIPNDGMFKLVTAPHYFFELVAWLGIACTTQQLNCFLAVGDMLSYLCGRSIATTRWYRNKFPEYPACRKHLIPFIF